MDLKPCLRCDCAKCKSDVTCTENNAWRFAAQWFDVNGHLTAATHPKFVRERNFEMLWPRCCDCFYGTKAHLMLDYTATNRTFNASDFIAIRND
jgi:hypothetical protein